jgi:U3 small nucleolar RNA-associated protein 14
MTKFDDYLIPVKAGWGDWAGPGSMGISKRTLNRRDALMKAVNEEADKKRAGRLDSSKKMLNVMISEKLVKGHSKYKLADIPHPFTTREEYEQSIKMPVGGRAHHTISILYCDMIIWYR